MKYYYVNIYKKKKLTSIIHICNSSQTNQKKKKKIKIKLIYKKKINYNTNN